MANPQIGNFDPASGSTIAINEAIEFDITDIDNNLQNEFVWVVYEDGSTEVVWDDNAFTAAFASNSTRTSITNGYHYTLRRFEGWPANPTINAKAVDGNGNESF